MLHLRAKLVESPDLHTAKTLHISPAPTRLAESIRPPFRSGPRHARRSFARQPRCTCRRCLRLPTLAFPLGREQRAVQFSVRVKAGGKRRKRDRRRGISQRNAVSGYGDERHDERSRRQVETLISRLHRGLVNPARSAFDGVVSISAIECGAARKSVVKQRFVRNFSLLLRRFRSVFRG